MVCGQKSCLHFDFSLNLLLNGAVLGLMDRVSGVSRKLRSLILLSTHDFLTSCVRGFGLYQYIASANLCIEFALFEQMDFIFSALDPSCLVLPIFCHYCTLLFMRRYLVHAKVGFATGTNKFASKESNLATPEIHLQLTFFKAIVSCLKLRIKLLNAIQDDQYA